MNKQWNKKTGLIIGRFAPGIMDKKMMPTHTTLIYVHDPMCGWCWGFTPVWKKTREALVQLFSPEQLSIRYVAGGLAPDSAKPMSADLAKTISGYWKRIEEELGTEFNHDFWALNTPRRSTYPACRAVIAARELGGHRQELAMISAIQEAYYLKAENPSNLSTLVTCAERIDLDRHSFEKLVESPECDALLQHDIQYARSIGGNSFPGLFLKQGSKESPVPFDYKDEAVTINYLWKP